MQILIVDDHALFREGVALLLSGLPECVEVLSAGSCEEAFSILEVGPPVDLVLFDLGLPGMSGMEGIKTMRVRFSEIPVIALSSSEDRATVLEALDAGAMGFVPKSSSSAILTAALRLILAKGIYLPPSVFLGDRRVVNGSSDEPIRDGGARVEEKPIRPKDLGITTRQADVLFRVLQGKSAKVICRELNLSPNTVKAHTSAVLRALNVTTRTQAVIAAGRIGLKF